MKKQIVCLGVLTALFGSFALLGCGEKPPEPSKETTQQSDRLTKIRESSGGDWNKVSESDKEWIIKDLCFGNEGSAKLMIAPAGKKPGGQPPTGPKTGP
jgi:hypothetical protein